MSPISLFFFSSRRRHTRSLCDWSSDVCSSDLEEIVEKARTEVEASIVEAGEHAIYETGIKGMHPELVKLRSEERRVGKECRSRWSRQQQKEKEEEEREHQTG